MAGRLMAQPVYPHSRLDWTAPSCPEFAHKGHCGRSPVHMVAGPEPIATGARCRKIFLNAA